MVVVFIDNFDSLTDKFVQLPNNKNLSMHKQRFPQ